MRMWLLVTLLACAPLPPAHDCDLSAAHVVVGTSDFVGGALAAVTAGDEGPCVADRLVTTGGDTVVRATDDHTWVLQRTGGDTLTAYAHGRYDTPEIEVVVAPGGNAHDLVQVGDEWFVSLYDEARIVVLDQRAREVGSVDLRSHADADGLPEVDRLVVTDAGVFASLQRLDRNDAWRGRDGRVVRIDPDTLEVAEAWTTGPNPRLAPHPDGRRLVALTGLYFEADGAMEVIDPDGGVEVVIAEADVRVDLGSYADDVVLATALEVGGDSVLGRVDDGDVVALRSSPAWYADALGTPWGVVVASRAGFAGEGAGELLMVGEDAAEVLATGFALDPFSLAWVPESGSTE